jgi:hypothetical protein
MAIAKELEISIDCNDFPDVETDNLRSLQDLWFIEFSRAEQYWAPMEC